MSEPMSEERLAVIRERMRRTFYLPALMTQGIYQDIREMIADRADLLAEVERLRHEVFDSTRDAENIAEHADRMERQNVALREIAQAVVYDAWYTHSSTLGGSLSQTACCPFSQCEQEGVDSRDIPHTDDCPVLKARKLINKTSP